MGTQKIEPVFQSFDSHQEADEANIAFYKSLSPDQKLEIALDLMKPYYEAYPRLERVYRFVECGACPVSRDWRMGV